MKISIIIMFIYFFKKNKLQNGLKRLSKIRIRVHTVNLVPAESELDSMRSTDCDIGKMWYQLISR